MSVRTATIVAATATTTLTTIYTVPDDVTVIVKELIYGKFGTPAQTCTVTVRRGAAAYGVDFASFSIGVNVFVRPHFTVLSPGDELRVQTDSGNIGVWVSGAKLAGVA